MPRRERVIVIEVGDVAPARMRLRKVSLTVAPVVAALTMEKSDATFDVSLSDMGLEIRQLSDDEHFIAWPRLNRVQRILQTWPTDRWDHETNHVLDRSMNYRVL
jgi:hypothetical protein